MIQLALLVIYLLRVYSLLHYNSGKVKYLQQYQQHNKQLQIILKAQKNQYKLKQLQQTIKSKRKSHYNQIVDIKKQFIQLYQQITYCPICQCLKPPRAVHCEYCNQCILRRQKHSDLINNCIGQNNVKVYIKYFFITTLTSLYMLITLIFIAVLEHRQINDLEDIKLSVFALEQMLLLIIVLWSIKQFSVTYHNLKNNITETQKNQKIFNQKNNPFNMEKYYDQLFQSNLDYLKIGQIGDYHQQLEMYQQTM